MMILDGKRIAFLGDSITHGECIANKSNGYVERVRRSKNWEKVLNYSVPGSRVGEYIGVDPRGIGPSFVQRYPDMDNEFDIVVVFGGTNDFGIGNEPLGQSEDIVAETFYGAVNVLMKGLKDKYPEAVIIFMTPLHRKNEDIPNEFNGAVLREYVEIIKQRAVRYDIYVLDLYSSDSLKPDDTYYAEIILEDGIHPNEKGHEIIAVELLEFMEKLEKN